MGDNNPSDEYLGQFDKVKIVWPDIMREPRSASKQNRQFPYFCLDREGFYQEATNFIMTGTNLSLLIAILNSKAGVYFFTSWFAGPQFDSKGFRYKKVYLENFLIPPITTTNQSLVDLIESLVDQILAAKKNNFKANTTKLEAQIDQMVYKFYGLTEEEIKMVEVETSARVATMPILESTPHKELTGQLTTL